MRFNRHAKNRLRRHELRRAEVETIVLDPIAHEIGPNGNPRYLGYVGDELFRVTVAKDDPELVISIHPRRHL